MFIDLNKERFIMLIKTFNTGILQVNTYLIIDEDSKEAIIIDLGGDFEILSEEIKKNNAKLKFILNTHGHFDHIMGESNPNINVPIMMHEDDEHHAENISEYMKKWELPPAETPIKITEFINENSNLTIGNKQIKIFHTPGHTRGGLCFLIENNLFSGDTLFWGTIGRTDLADGNYELLVSSIKNKLMPLDDSITVYPGHGDPTSIGFERKNNEFLK